MSFNNQDALETLAGELKIGLAFNEHGICDVVIDGIHVTLAGYPAATDLRINAVVGNLRDADDPAALRLLLHANFNGQGVGASCLGVNHETNEVVLGRSVDVSTLGEKGLAPVVEDFANYLAFWKQNLLRLAESAKGGHIPERVALDASHFLKV